MASVTDLANLRLMVDEATEEFYTDADLEDRIDAAALAGYSLSYPAWQVWVEKAARYSSLVNISEGGSSRANGDLFSRAKAMADMYKGLVDKETSTISNVGVVISQLTR